MSIQNQEPASSQFDFNDEFVSRRKPKRESWDVPCILILAAILLAAFLIYARPFGGTLLALAVIGGSIALLVRREWQDQFFSRLRVNSRLKRFAVLGLTILSMLVTFRATTIEKADALWADGKHDEAVKIYANELKYAKSPDSKLLKRVIKFYFENDDVYSAKTFCKIAAEADVNLAFDAKELRELLASAKSELEADNNLAQEVKATASANKEGATERKRRGLLKTYLNIIKLSNVTVIDSVSVQNNPFDAGEEIWEVTIKVKNPWHLKPCQIRLQSAQDFWKAWSKIASPDDPDSARIKIVDLNDNEVGGSRVLAGSLIWVQKK